MVVEDREIDRLARALIEKYGDRAARIAAERLNRMIDRNNTRGRDIWACVVHAIHQQQGGDETALRPVTRSRGRRTPVEN